MQALQTAPNRITAPLTDGLDDFDRRAFATAQRMLIAQQQYKENELTRLLRIKELKQQGESSNGK